MVAFVLRAFDDGLPPPAIDLGGHIDRRGQRLSLHFSLRGCIDQLAIPSPVPLPSRRDELWQATCFECFFGLAGQPSYWEVNLSPAGHWNVYRLAHYRHSLKPDAGFDQLPFSVDRRTDGLRLTLEFQLPGSVGTGAPLEVALASVIRDHQGRLSYWALGHPGPEPDFHRRDGFLLRL